MLAGASKADLLLQLYGQLQHAEILPAQVFSLQQWQTDAQGVLQQILTQPWGQQALIVRSSALGEDQPGQSQAGVYLSVPEVTGEMALRQAIEQVLATYPSQHNSQQVLIQPMLSQIDTAGVAFSREPSTGGPYYVISHGPEHNSVTAGQSAVARVYVHHSLQVLPPAPWPQVIALLQELQARFPASEIDLEFAFAAGQLYLLQVRALSTQSGLSDAAHQAQLKQIAQSLARHSAQHPDLLGAQAVFGIMPDWNPAEIIGVRPRPLALSLYRELVTDNIWAYQRDHYGYRNLRSFPLMLSFGGCPYIDVRVSFNSFLPADLPEPLAERLVNHYLQRLQQEPAHHDKIEFEIIFSCYSLDLPQRLQALQACGFSPSDCEQLAQSLRQLTNRVLNAEHPLWKQDLERIEQLIQRQTRLQAAKLDPVSEIYWLLEDGKRYGTLPFAGLARAGFMAVQLLRSLQSSGILSAAEIQRFFTSLKTVSSRLHQDFNQLSRQDFLSHYGHLRPGSYDILSPRYDQMPERYFDWNPPASVAAQLPAPEPEPFQLSLGQMRAIEALLHKHGLEIDLIRLFDFIQAAIEGREYAKFIFSRNLSLALQRFGELAAAEGFSLEQASFAEIQLIRELYVGSEPAQKLLQASIHTGQQAHQATQSLSLPPLLTEADQLWCFRVEAAEPSYITLKRVQGPVCQASELASLPGSIVLIPAADPGYDWIFLHGIAGFITCYGGANSHMAIRAQELNLPAIIGAGELLYQRWSQARYLDLDCANRQVYLI